MCLFRNWKHYYNLNYVNFVIDYLCGFLNKLVILDLAIIHLAIIHTQQLVPFEDIISDVCYLPY